MQKIEVTCKKSFNKVNILRLGFLDSIAPISTIEFAPDGLEFFFFFFNFSVKSTTLCIHPNMSDNDVEFQYSITKQQTNYLFLIKSGVIKFFLY